MGDEDIGYLIVDVGSEKEDTIFEEAGDDIELSTGGAVDCGEDGGWLGWFGLWLIWLLVGFIGHHPWIVGGGGE